MSPRDTTTGSVLESMILPALSNGGYDYETQVHVGKRMTGRRHIIDVLAKKEGRSYLVSLKWQQVSGTAEQKVPFELVCLVEAVLESAGGFDKGYLVLGGEGWSLRDYYTGGGLRKYFEYNEMVDIVTLEGFVAAANRGRL